MEQFSLHGKNIVVTGASSGIGRQTSITCSEAGAILLIFGRNKERLDETLSMLKGAGKHSAVSLDLLNYAAVEPVIEEFVVHHGKLHGLIHAAGISTTLPLKLISPEKLDEYFHVNVSMALNLTKICTKQSFMRSEGGSIVFISSVMGTVGESGKTIYSITKGALLAGTKSLALELASKKIRVNTISPGVVKTPMSANAVYSQDEESLKKVTALHPLGLGNPDDVANACVFMLSDASRWITGSNLTVDGGYTAR